MSRQEQLALYAQQIVQSEGVPPFALHARELLDRSLDPESGTSALTRVILKDLGLTSQLLRTANSPLYNRSGRPIGGIAHAITLLGWDAVRNLVGAMRYVEHYARHSPGLRELMMFSLLSATHGRQVACLTGYGRPEEAYVSGLLRSLGEVSLARFFGREYADMVMMVKREQITEKMAALRVFNFDLDELTAKLAEEWKLPDMVRMSLRDGVPAGTLEQKSLASITSYGYELTRALYRRAQRVDALQLRTVLNPLGRQCLISRTDLRRIVDTAVEDTKSTFQALSIPVGSLRIEEQADRAREALELGLFDPEEAPAQNLGLDLDSVLSAAQVRIDNGDFEIGELIVHLLDALTTPRGFRKMVFALMSEDRDFIRGRLAGGPTAEADRKAFRFSVLRADAALTAAVDRRQDLWVHRGADKRYEESRVVGAFDPVRFALFPVVVDDVVAGVLYADSDVQNESLRTVLERVRTQIAGAIGRKRMN